MIIKSPNHSHFYRKDGVVIEVTTDGKENPLFQFPKRFIDIAKLQPSMVDYMNRWMEYYPDQFIKIEAKKEEGQLKLF